MLTSHAMRLFTILTIILACHVSSAQVSEEGTTIGALPQSMNWFYDQPSSFVFIGLNQLHLDSPVIQQNLYTASFDSPDINFISLQYFSRLYKSHSSDSLMSLWMRYGLGVSTKQGNVTSSAFQVSNNSSHSYLGSLLAQIGIQMSYDYWRTLRPYLGAQVLGVFYRNTSPLSAAESDGQGYGYEPVLGIQ